MSVVDGARRYVFDKSQTGSYLVREAYICTREYGICLQNLGIIIKNIECKTLLAGITVTTLPTLLWYEESASVFVLRIEINLREHDRVDARITSIGQPGH